MLSLCNVSAAKMRLRLFIVNGVADDKAYFSELTELHLQADKGRSRFTSLNDNQLPRVRASRTRNLRCIALSVEPCSCSPMVVAGNIFGGQTRAHQ